MDATRIRSRARVTAPSVTAQQTGCGTLTIQQADDGGNGGDTPDDGTDGGGDDPTGSPGGGGGGLGDNTLLLAIAGVGIAGGALLLG